MINKGEFELFLFAEILISNREKLKESESFILTLQKDKLTSNSSLRRINIKNLVSLTEMINKPYSKITIEIKDNNYLEELNEIIKKEGETEINLIINHDNKKLHYNLQKNRKFDFDHLKALKSKKYVKNYCLDSCFFKFGCIYHS